jgi:outer membrane receptor for ferrienterochelin and colicin
VQALPGVAVVDDGSSEPAVRGSRPSDNAYVVDFLPVGYLFHLGGFASVFNPNLIRRFSMASAAWSPEYGNVVGAVFDINLRNPRSDRLGGQLDFSLLGANGLFEGPINDEISLFIAARRSWFDLVVNSVEDKEEGVTVTTPVYSDSQGRFLWTLNSRNRLRLDFSTANDRLDFEVKSGGKAAQRDPLIAGRSDEKQSFATAALVWESDFGSIATHRIALGQMKQDQSFRLGGAGTVKVGTDTTYMRQQLIHTGFAGHELSLGSTVDSRLIDAKLDFNFPRCTEFDPNCDISTAPRLITNQRARQNVFGLYVNDRWELNPQWTTIVGLRLSREAYLDRNAAEPRLGLEYSPVPTLTFSAGLGRHSQPPAGEESLAVIGNPRLKPIESDHAVLGVSQRLAAGWSWRAEVYGKRFDNYAVSDPVLNYRNGASGNARGLELLIKKDPAGSKLSGFASVSVSRSRRKVDATGENFPFDYDQPVNATVVANYKQNERWSYGLKWSYHTGSPYTPVVGTGLFPDGRVRPIFGSINSQRLPAYHRLDLRVDAQITPRFSWYAELINVYNRKNVAGYDYSPDYKTRTEIEQLPLLPSVGVKYTF